MENFTTKASAAAQPLKTQTSSLTLLRLSSLIVMVSVSRSLLSFFSIHFLNEKSFSFLFSCTNEGENDLQELYGKEIN
jgi:hypothetical protein